MVRLVEGLRWQINLLHPPGNRSPILTLQDIKFRKGEADTRNH